MFSYGILSSLMFTILIDDSSSKGESESCDTKKENDEKHRDGEQDSSPAQTSSRKEDEVLGIANDGNEEISVRMETYFLYIILNILLLCSYNATLFL